MYCLEIHTKKRRMLKRVPEEFQPYKTYYRTFGEYKELKKKARKLRRKGWRTSMYSDQFARSSTYREMFFAYNAPDQDGKYQCVYCGRRLPKEKIVVDHVISVGAAKSGRGRGLHGKSVNDLSKLVPACERCNMRKGSNGGLWPLKARLGRHPAWFPIKRTIILLIIVAVVTFFIASGYGGTMMDYFRRGAGIIRSFLQTL